MLINSEQKMPSFQHRISIEFRDTDNQLRANNLGKNRLLETGLLSTHNMFGRQIKKKRFSNTHIYLETWIGPNIILTTTLLFTPFLLEFFLLLV